MANILDEILGDNQATYSNDEIQQCATDLEKFARKYFPEYFGNTWCDFHYDMVGFLEDIILRKKQKENKFVVAAPRGHAKSTIFTFLCVMWCVCYKYKKVIVVITATNTMAKKFIIDCRTEFEFNEKIIADFGNLKDDILWSANEFCTKNGVYVCGKGAGEQMRGLKWKGSRPDLVLIDDLETKESVSTELQRANLEDWFTGDVLPMGMPNCDYLMVGTILSYSSLLYNLLHEPRFSSWERHLYKAVIQDSESPLWNEWEKIVLDPKRENSMDDGYNFYIENKIEMLRDVKVLWGSQREDMYLYLRGKRIENEEKYNSEFQNDPMTESLRDFKEEWIKSNTYTELPEIVEYYGACDPSLGKTKSSDTSAIIILGKGIDNYIYVIEANVCRRSPDSIINDLIATIVKYRDKLKGFVIETNVMQEYLASNIKQRFIDVGIYVNWIEVKHRTSKELRIKGMIPKIKNGYIKFNLEHRTLITQLKNYPKGHDDAVDCLEMALEPIMSLSSAAFCFDRVDFGSNKQEQSLLSKALQKVRRW